MTRPKGSQDRHIVSFYLSTADLAALDAEIAAALKQSAPGTKLSRCAYSEQVIVSHLRRPGAVKSGRK